MQNKNVQCRSKVVYNIIAHVKGVTVTQVQRFKKRWTTMVKEKKMKQSNSTKNF